MINSIKNYFQPYTSAAFTFIQTGALAAGFAAQKVYKAASQPLSLYAIGTVSIAGIAGFLAKKHITKLNANIESLNIKNKHLENHRNEMVAELSVIKEETGKSIRELNFQLSALQNHNRTLIKDNRNNIKTIAKQTQQINTTTNINKSLSEENTTLNIEKASLVNQLDSRNKQAKNNKFYLGIYNILIRHLQFRIKRQSEELHVFKEPQKMQQEIQRLQTELAYIQTQYSIAVDYP